MTQVSLKTNTASESSPIDRLFDAKLPKRMLVVWNYDDVQFSSLHTLEEGGNFCCMLVRVLRMADLLLGDIPVFLAWSGLGRNEQTIRASQGNVAHWYALIRAQTWPLVWQTAEGMADGESLPDSCLSLSTWCCVFAGRSVWWGYDKQWWGKQLPRHSSSISNQLWSCQV